MKLSPLYSSLTRWTLISALSTQFIACGGDDSSNRAPTQEIPPQLVPESTTEAASSNVIINASFEEWGDDGRPSGWSRIDSGLSVDLTTDKVQSGDSAVAITAVENKQNFAQTISVKAGTKYTFKTQVFHPDVVDANDAVRARYFVDGYSDEYSDFDQANTWQEYTHSYTATQDGDIEFGFRFYYRDKNSISGNGVILLDNITVEEASADTETGSGDSPPPSTPPSGKLPTEQPVLSEYYKSAENLNDAALKTALHAIIKTGHIGQSYGAIWDFYADHELDAYFEQDGSILDIYSEVIDGVDSKAFAARADQCGNYSGEGDCYNREHSFPKSWFGGKISPMNEDIHHIFASDGYVNSKRESFPYGEVATAEYTSFNGSKVGKPAEALGYSGNVFEPIDVFKGDVARAHFYMVTRYEDQLSGWQTLSEFGDAVLNGTAHMAFEPWALKMLLRWHEQDPVSNKETNRNNQAYLFQGNRNPFVDDPSFVEGIWGESSDVEVTPVSAPPASEPESSTGNVHWVNGDFNEWDQAGQPTNWQIDSGITLSQSDDPTEAGNTIANVLVTTSAKNGDRDFRQSVNLTADTTYVLSARVYQVNGYVKARLAATNTKTMGGYSDYSDHTAVGEWQTITFEFTATEDAASHVGLRFYDEDDSVETASIYVDDVTLVVK